MRKTLDLKDRPRVPKVILTCGRICGGKSVYAKRLRDEMNALMFSADEVMLAVFGQHAGEQHDVYVGRVIGYLFEKSREAVGAGVNVVLDAGLWTKDERASARAYFEGLGVACEIHYVAADDDVRRRRVAERNKAVLAGTATAYFIDEALAMKADSRFEEPLREEVDCWVDASGG